MKKKKPEVVEWSDLQVGDFIENKESKLFCFSIANGNPSCLGKNKEFAWKYRRYWGLNAFEHVYKRMKPTKGLIKMCKQLLTLNLKDKSVDNLSYIEALAALKKYE